LSHSVPFQHRHKHLEVRVTDDGALELYLDNCLRKRREPGDLEPQYVWTNVELEWEEHHYVEARFWPSRRQLTVQVNRAPLLDTRLLDR
jgi:hypothetical protein